MRNWRRWWLIWGCAMLLSASAAQASDVPQPPGGDVVDSMMGKYNLYPAFAKLGRGVSNALGGWLEIPLNVGKRQSQTDTAGGFFTGLAIGTFRGLVRTGVGVYETATFFLPYPEDFAPILPTLEYFQKSSRRKPLPLE